MNRRRVLVLVVVGVGVLLGVACGGSLILDVWQFFHWRENHPADTAATAENAAAAAAQAGLGSVDDLQVIAVRHQYEIDDETWSVTWLGEPEAAQRLIKDSSFAVPPKECAQVEVYGSGRVQLDGCQTVNDQWRGPDGYLVSRTVVHGRLPDGRYVISLRAIGP